MPPLLDTSALVPYTLAYNNVCWHEAMCFPIIEGAECTWHAAGVDEAFHCGLERDTQAQVWRHLPVDSVVLEVGSRYGTVSCTISKRQRYSGWRVSVEPDEDAFHRFLQVNVRANRCAGVQVNGVVSNSRAAFSSGAGYGGAAMAAPGGTIPGYNISSLQSLLPTSRRFTALFLDCEGCALAFLTEQADLLRGPHLEHIFLELDQRQGDLRKVLRRLCAHGFELLASDPNLTCCPTILHLVFQRASSRGSDEPSRDPAGSAATSMRGRAGCSSMLALATNFEKRAQWTAREAEEHAQLGTFAWRVFGERTVLEGHTV